MDSYVDIDNDGEDTGTEIYGDDTSEHGSPDDRDDDDGDYDREYCDDTVNIY